MEFLEDQLEIKKSNLEGAGNGLFTTKAIPKGTIILEYTGTVTSWKAVNDEDCTNGYLFYVTRNHVIDASKHLHVLGRYVNDAKGLSRIKGYRNNARYIKEKGKIYLEAIYNIPAGSEIMAHYGDEYWQSIKYNSQLEKV